MDRQADMTGPQAAVRGGAGGWRAVVLVFLPFAGGYFLSYLYRSVNAVISGRLTEDLGLSATDLGLLTAAYFLTFAAFQIPLGILLDKFGPRRVQSVLLLFAALGALLFAVGESRDALLLGRAFIGLGVAGGLMASFKAIVLWFPEQRWPLVNGAFVAMGGLGAMAATEPVELAVQAFSWREVFWVLAGLTVLVAAAIFLVVPERAGGARRHSARAQLAGVGEVFRSRYFWALAPVTCLTVSAGMALQGLWAGPWLRDVAGFDEAGMASQLLLVAVGLTVGSLAIGISADLAQRSGISLVKVIACGVPLFFLAQSLIILEVAPRGGWLWPFFTLTSNVAMLAYPLYSSHFGLALSGRANTAINMLAFFAAFGYQAAVGVILDFWEPVDGVFPAEAYRSAFMACLALQLLAYAWFLISLPRLRKS